jgi:uncharacterized protein YjbJ (UPF0337 family)
MILFSISKQLFSQIKLCLSIISSIIIINLGIASPALATPLAIGPNDHLAAFGLERQVEGKTEQIVGKTQSQMGDRVEGTVKQINGRAKYDIGRVEDSVEHTIDKTTNMAKDVKEGTENNLK